MARVDTNTRQMEMLLTPLRLEEDPISQLARLNSG